MNPQPPPAMTSKILLVDDDTAILEAAQRSLRRHFTLEVASSAGEALNKIEMDGPYAVIVTDMHMPLMNGVELLRQAESIAPETVRIMMSGNLDRRGSLETFNQCRLFRLLTKPCLTATLIQAIEAGLKHFSAATALSQRTVSHGHEPRAES